MSAAHLPDTTPTLADIFHDSIRAGTGVSARVSVYDGIVVATVADMADCWIVASHLAAGNAVAAADGDPERLWMLVDQTVGGWTVTVGRR